MKTGNKVWRERNEETKRDIYADIWELIRMKIYFNLDLKKAIMFSCHRFQLFIFIIFIILHLLVLGKCQHTLTDSHNIITPQRPLKQP